MRALLALASLTFALTAPAFGDNLMAGRWYTEGVEEGLHLQSVIDNHPDGTFVKSIRNGTDCEAISSWVETGTWSFDGKRYVETTETVSGQKVDAAVGDFKDTFDVAPIDDTHVSLTDAKTSITWTFTKVDPNFTMSPPKDCTV
ncbi:MAG TPA: hypothetical protein VMU22_08240 [Rhizomicrobium sp.]|nr:hypothetical protein [Rhizomicrobium sp.]